ncbi:MAG: YezD family protein [Verrucomicrobia bacterium]|nr:YezD family protein [Verrucomicrobiota bacterium]
MKSLPANHDETNGDNSATTWRKVVNAHVNSLRFGVIQIVVHDSRVVQIERTEKVRFDQRGAVSA